MRCLISSDVTFRLRCMKIYRITLMSVEVVAMKSAMA